MVRQGARLCFAGIILAEIATAVGFVGTVRPLFAWGLVATAAIAWGALEGVDAGARRVGASPVPAWVRGAVIIAVSVDALGTLRDWYYRLPGYDAAAHVVGGFATAAALFPFFRVLAAARRVSLPPWWVASLAFLTMSFLSLAFEVGEFSLDLALGVTFWHGGGPDTISDLVANAAGGILAVVLLALQARPAARPVRA